MSKRHCELLGRLELSQKDALSCFQLVIDPSVIDLNHFLAPLLKMTMNTLCFAWSDTICNSIKSLKWSRWSWGSTFPSYALIFESLNPSSSGAFRISLQKGEASTSKTSLSSCSSIVTMAHCRSSNEMFLNPWEFVSVHTLWVIECWECSCSYLLLRVSLISAPLPSLLNIFPVVLFPWLLLVRTTSERPLFLFDFDKWKNTAPALGSIPVCWDLTTIKFSPVCYEAAICCPLVASFLLVLTDVKTCRDHSLCWWIPLFTYEDLRSSRRASFYYSFNYWWGHVVDSAPYASSWLPLAPWQLV